ncbi:MAG: hypothetical protein JST59_29060 [Actinobacteria bacterium]|nr:hypothetical protein [Actinomycetota bacterium]
MVLISRRLRQGPNRTQVALEGAHHPTRRNIVATNMDPATGARWLPFVATLFFWIWFPKRLATADDVLGQRVGASRFADDGSPSMEMMRARPELPVVSGPASSTSPAPPSRTRSQG